MACLKTELIWRLLPSTSRGQTENPWSSNEVIFCSNTSKIPTRNPRLIFSHRERDWQQPSAGGVWPAYIHYICMWWASDIGRIPGKIWNNARWQASSKFQLYSTTPSLCVYWPRVLLIEPISHETDHSHISALYTPHHFCSFLRKIHDNAAGWNQSLATKFLTWRKNKMRIYSRLCGQAQFLDGIWWLQPPETGKPSTHDFSMSETGEFCPKEFSPSHGQMLRGRGTFPRGEIHHSGPRSSRVGIPSVICGGSSRLPLTHTESFYTWR